MQTSFNYSQLKQLPNGSHARNQAEPVTAASPPGQCRAAVLRASTVVRRSHVEALFEVQDVRRPKPRHSFANQTTEDNLEAHREVVNQGNRRNDTHPVHLRRPCSMHDQ